jgi:hypothetical protein
MKLNKKHIKEATGSGSAGGFSAPLFGEMNEDDYCDSCSKLKSKCPINTKAAIRYNDLLQFKGLDKQYSKFQIGDKMLIAYLKDNPFKIDCIGFNGYNDPPQIIEFIEKYINRGLLFDSVMKNKIEGLYSDIGWGMPIFNANFNKFFTFD